MSDSKSHLSSLVQLLRDKLPKLRRRDVTIVLVVAALGVTTYLAIGLFMPSPNVPSNIPAGRTVHAETGGDNSPAFSINADGSDRFSINVTPPVATKSDSERLHELRQTLDAIRKTVDAAESTDDPTELISHVQRL